MSVHYLYISIMLKKISIVSFAVVAALLSSSVQETSVHAFPSGAPVGQTASPTDASNCTSCHGGTATNVPALGVITSTIPGSGFVPGTTYAVTVTVSGCGSGEKGFQASPQNSSGMLFGTLAAGATTQLVGSGKYITHLNAPIDATHTWSFDWTAPATGANGTLYVASVCSKPNTKLCSLPLTRSLTTGIDNTEATIGFKMNNSAENKTITIAYTMNQNTDVVLQLVDMQGKIVESQTFAKENGEQQHTLSTSNVATGIYILKAQIGKQLISKKVVL